jgi:hypothetical protein
MVPITNGYADNDIYVIRTLSALYAVHARTIILLCTLIHHRRLLFYAASAARNVMEKEKGRAPRYGGASAFPEKQEKEKKW